MKQEFSTEPEQKLMQCLADLIQTGKKKGKLVVAFSGGVDSSVLSWAAKRVDEKVVAITVAGQFMAARDMDRACEVAEHLGLDHHLIAMDHLSDERIVSNGPDRCYWCKRGMFKTIKEHFAESVMLLEGGLADDDPTRPGLKAVDEMGVISPMARCGLNKGHARAMASRAGLPNAADQSNSCLATRISRGERLNADKLILVDKLESCLSSKGYFGHRAVITNRSLKVYFPDCVQGEKLKKDPSFSEYLKEFDLSELRTGVRRQADKHEHR